MSEAVQIELLRQVGVLIQAIPAGLGAWFAWKSYQKGQEIHQQGERNYNQINGRMDQLLTEKGLAGEAIGQQRERDRAKVEEHHGPPA